MGHVQMLVQFSEWLHVERGQFFNELSSEDTRALFKDFVAAWNARQLPARIYMGVADASLRRTKHSWAIRGAAFLVFSHGSRGKSPGSGAQYFFMHSLEGALSC